MDKIVVERVRFEAPHLIQIVYKERSSCKEKDLAYYTAFILREMNRMKLMDLSSKDFL